MKILSLRFGENFAPECGTIMAHSAMIERNGFVWYGKFGNPVSEKILKVILQEKDPKLLLIKSGSQERYWAHLESVQRLTPDLQSIPEYYRHMTNKVKCWFKITNIERAPDDAMSHCRIISSGAMLSSISKVSMNPCTFVEYLDE